MRYLFLILFMLFAVLPVTAQSVLVEPIALEAVDMHEADDFATGHTLYISAPDPYYTTTEKPEYYAGLAPSILWRPPMGQNA